MIGNDNNISEDSPKRRSTFYVSLETENMNHANNNSKINKKKLSTTIVRDIDKYTCNTFPISNCKNQQTTTTTIINKKKTGLSRTQSTSNDIEKIDTCRNGKVQTLTKIFETPKLNDNNIIIDNNNIKINQTFKKIERTRSFKTIEKLQNRFVNNGNKKNGDINRDKLNNNNSKNNYIIDNNGSCSTIINDKKSKDDVDRMQKSQLIHSLKQKNNMENSNSSFGNLIRRTHSTKVTKSSSSLINKSSIIGRHGSIDSPTMGLSKFHLNNNDNNLRSDFIGDNNTNESNDFEYFDESGFDDADGDAGIHSGTFVFIYVLITISLVDFLLLFFFRFVDKSGLMIFFFEEKKARGTYLLLYYMRACILSGGFFFRFYYHELASLEKIF